MSGTRENVGDRPKLYRKADFSIKPLAEGSPLEPVMDLSR